MKKESAMFINSFSVNHLENLGEHWRTLFISAQVLQLLGRQNDLLGHPNIIAEAETELLGGDCLSMH